MPEPAVLVSTTGSIEVKALDLNRLSLIINADGNGSAIIPYRNSDGVATDRLVSNIPGSALAVIASHKLHGVGFKIFFSRFTHTFDALTVGKGLF